MSFQKADTGKPQWSLLPWDVLLGVVHVLGFGAAKYSTKTTVPVSNLSKKLVQFCSCERTSNGQIATLSDSTQHTDYVSSATASDTQRQSEQPATQDGWRNSGPFAGPAMTAISSRETRSTQSGNGRPTRNGQPSTPTESGTTSEPGPDWSGSRNGTLQTTESDCYSATGLLGKMSTECSSGRTSDAGSAGASRANGSLTSTTTTGQARCEDCSATDATRGLGFSGTVRTLLGGHSATCNVHRLTISQSGDDAVIEQSGANNWCAGADWSRYYNSTMRHMVAWWMGESLDPETGRSHLLHAICGLLFLAAYEIRGIGRDDRPTIPLGE